MKKGDMVIIKEPRISNFLIRRYKMRDREVGIVLEAINDYLYRIIFSRISLVKKVHINWVEVINEQDE